MSGEAVGSARRMTRDWQAEYLRLDLRCALMEQLLDATSGEIETEVRWLAEARCKLAKALKEVLDFVAQSDTGEGKQPRVAIRARTRRTSRKYKNRTEGNAT